MALTGLMMVGFLIAHMIGNLKIYIGTVEHNGHQVQDIDVYSEFLKELLVPIVPSGVVLWLMRLGLLAGLILHIHSAYSLTQLNLKSDLRYQSKRDYIAANFASRTMRWTGPILGLYIVAHLADLTLGKGGLATSEFVTGEVYNNVIYSLSRPLVAIFYIVANIVVVVHVYHGIWSAFQSLGINNPKYNKLRRQASMVISAILLIGNLSFPIAILAGAIEI